MSLTKNKVICSVKADTVATKLLTERIVLMSHIVAKLRPNNKLQIKHFCLGDGHFRQKAGRDTSLERDKEKLGRYLRTIDIHRDYIRQYQKVATYTVPVEYVTQRDIFGNPTKTKIREETREKNYCTIPDRIPVVYEDPVTGVCELVHKDYYDLIKENKSLLDLFKKSQYGTQKERPWGKKQKPKVFRAEAGEKIKEGGAIIDRFVGVKHSHMLTLTLPGSTTVARSALSRWSGWVVNRLLQVLRNRREDYKDMFWFFTWEHQKNGALHLHFCLGWKVSWIKRENLLIQVKDKFYALLKELSQKEQIDMFYSEDKQLSWASSPKKWQYDIQRIRKSVASYFAKYCQKNTELSGDNGDKSNRTEGKDDANGKPENKEKTLLYPSRYWGSSRTIKKWAKFITSQRKDTFVDNAHAEHHLDSIRRKIGAIFDFKSVSRNPFQIECPRSGQVICSGYVETYTVDPRNFVPFWVYCMDAIIERDKSMYKEFDEFLATEGKECQNLEDESLEVLCSSSSFARKTMITYVVNQ